MSRQINDEMLGQIKEREGLKLSAYRDTGGVLTIGYGHTKGVRAGTTCTQEQADQWLREDLAEAEDAVSNTVTVQLDDNQFSALADFTYNVGQGNLESSTLLRKLNAGDYASVPEEMNKWTHDSRGNKLGGLVSRRAAEGEMFSRGVAQTVSFSEDVGVQPIGAKLFTPEGAAMGMPAVTSLFAAANHPGPIEWAVAIAIVMLAATGIYYFAFKRRK